MADNAYHHIPKQCCAILSKDVSFIEMLYRLEAGALLSSIEVPVDLVKEEVR